MNVERPGGGHAVLKRSLRVCCLGLSISVFQLFAWAASPGEAVLGQAIAKETREIFKQTCAECHGPDLIRPKKDFGYVLDLPRIAANPDYIVPGDPKKSDLYQLIEDDEMPGDNSKSGPLTLQQKELIRRWIELGAPSPDSAPAATPPPAEHLGNARKQDSTARHLRRWTGEFHPALTHFPIALFFAATLAYFFKQPAAMTFCLRLSALAAPVAALMGWFNAEFATFTTKSAALLAWHRWLGVGAAVLTVAAWLFSLNPRAKLGMILLVGSVITLAAGAAGGFLVYGLDHYKW